MKRRMILLITLIFTAALGSMALAQNAPSDVGIETACGFGSCFAPNYTAEGQTAVYKLTGGTSGKVEATDACIVGDTYKVIVKNSSTSMKKTFKSSGTLACTCTAPAATTGWAPQASLTLAGANKVKMKALHLPGGIPAGALIRMAGTWKRTQGDDSCGF